MIYVDNIPMLTCNITPTNNIQRKIINNTYFPLLSFIQPSEKGFILSHVMSAPRVDYPLFLHKMTKLGLRSFDLEGEIIIRYTYSGLMSFKELNLLL